MISASDAHSVILSNKAPDQLFSISESTLDRANGLFLGEDIHAVRNQPPFDRAMMDGIAVSSSALSLNFNKEGIARAGFPRMMLRDEEACIEVMTGAPVPTGCDCVIPYEDIQDTGVSFQVVNPDYNLVFNKFVHKESSDYKKGDLLLKKGIVINSTIISLLHSVGLTSVKVLRLNSIAIVSTGDELVDGGQRIEDHQIYKSNPFAIRSEILSFFPNSKVNLFHLDDEESGVESGLSKILGEYKVIIISGGVSKGKYDFIPSTLKKLGAKESFHKVKQRPGKPLWFGKGQNGQLIFGLPGNPVSCLINTRRHIIPLFESFLNNDHKSSYSVTSSADLEIGSSFTHFIPVSLSVVEGCIYSTPTIGNNSGDFSKLVFSRGFIEIPNDEGKVVKGKTYEFFPWGSLENRL